MVEVLADPVGVQLWRLGETELLQLVTGLSTWCTQLEALRLRAVAEVEHRGSARAVGATGTARWLTQATRITPGAANRALELAVALHGAPAVAAALAAGQISVAHAQVIMSTLAGLPRDLPEQGRADCASYLLLAATGEDPTVLARRGTDLTHRFHPESVADMEQRAVTRRELRIGTTPVDGVVPIMGWLDTEAAELARTVLSPLAAPRPRTDTERDLRSPAHRLADAFAELCQRAADHQCVPGEGYTRPHLTLTIDATTLSTGHGPAAALPLLGSLSAAAARRVACDAEITPITLDEHLVPLDVGRATYLVTGGLRRALTARDHGCAFPGCGRPPAWCHAHHIRHWADGGPTALTNLVLLCGYHHRAVHHHGWHVHLGDDGHPWFTPPPWTDPTQTPRPAHTQGPAPPTPHIAA
jgi:hypothetical protein